MFLLWGLAIYIPIYFFVVVVGLCILSNSVVNVLHVLRRPLTCLFIMLQKLLNFNFISLVYNIFTYQNFNVTLVKPVILFFS